MNQTPDKVTLASIDAWARAVAAVLPHGPWSLDPSPQAGRPITNLRRADGAGMHFDCDARTGKAEISGHYPRADHPDSAYFGPSGYGSDPRINISVSVLRDPAAAAKDIAKRFLPDYLARYAKGLQDKCAHEESTARAEDDIRRLIAAADSGAPAQHSRRPGYAWISVPGGHVERRGGSDIKIEVTSVPIDAAVAIIEILKKHRKETD